MDTIAEDQLKRVVKPILDRGRPDDFEHTLRTIDYARQLLLNEEGDEEIVIPTLYLHDIGWSEVNYTDWVKATPSKKKHMASLAEHMKQGAILAKRILKKMGYDGERIRTIASIIAIHDRPEEVFALGDPSAIMIVEADRLDRYGPESLGRYYAMFRNAYLEGAHRKEAVQYLREGLELWFKTKTAKSMAMALAEESGLFI